MCVWSSQAAGCKIRKDTKRLKKTRKDNPVFRVRVRGFRLGLRLGLEFMVSVRFKGVRIRVWVRVWPGVRIRVRVRFNSLS